MRTSKLNLQPATPTRRTFAALAQGADGQDLYSQMAQKYGVSRELIKRHMLGFVYGLPHRDAEEIWAIAERLFGDA